MLPGPADTIPLGCQIPLDTEFNHRCSIFLNTSCEPVSPPSTKGGLLMPEPVVTINVALVQTGNGLKYRVTRPFYGSQVHLGDFATKAEALEFANDFMDRLKAIRGQSAKIAQPS
jgi:hypothetical protein